MNYLKETIARFLSKNPSYFRPINIVLVILMCITGLPEVITLMGFTNPVWLQIVSSKTIAIVAGLLRLGFQLPTTNPFITSKDSSYSAPNDDELQNTKP